MKKHIAIILLLLNLCLCACNTTNSPNTFENNPSPSVIYPFYFDSLTDFQHSINKDERKLHDELSQQNANQKVIENFDVFVNKLKSQGIIAPHINNQALNLRNEEGFSSISLYPSEQYDLPCVFYHPAVSTGENLYIKMTYLPDSIMQTQERLTASAVRKKLAPNSANIGNLGEQHKSIYEQKIQLADREVTALVIEYKADKRNSTIFVYNDMLIEVRNNPNVWTEEWFATLSFDSYKG